MPKYFRFAFARSGDKTAVPDAVVPGGDVSYDQGYGPDYQLAKTNPQAKDIERNKMNQILNDVTDAVRYIQENGVSAWIAAADNGAVAFPYLKGSRVRYIDGNVYEAQVATSATPGASADWLLVTPRPNDAVVGSARNLRAGLAAANASLTITADEVVVKSALGLGARATVLSAFNEIINVGTVGAGGMDVGAAPVSGWVAIYAIFNPTTGAVDLLGVNATAAVAPEIYGGANMPAGYTQSALLSVWRTTAASILDVCRQFDREFYYFNSLLSTAVNVGFTTLSMAAAVPRNAWRWRGNFAFNPSGTATHSAALCPTSAGQGTPGYTSFSGYGVAAGLIGASIPEIPIFTAQTTFYALTAVANLTINSYGYSI